MSAFQGKDITGGDVYANVNRVSVEQSQLFYRNTSMSI